MISAALTATTAVLPWTGQIDPWKSITIPSVAKASRSGASLGASPGKKEHPMNQHHNQAPQNRLQRFASLRWYDATIRFAFSFVAKTSEVLLAAGVVVSTANFLTDGSVMGTHTGLAEAWSWAQALAIDSSL